MKKLIKLFAILCLLFVVLSIPAHAEEDLEPVNPIEEFADLFALESHEFIFVPEYRPLLLDTEMINATVIEDVEVDYNEFGQFAFMTGLGKKRISTFTTDKTLVGQGAEGMSVGMLVYSYNDDGEREVYDYKYKTIGASGLFSDVICFKPASKQYLVVAVTDDESTISRVYEVTTKEEITRSILENFELDFMPTIEEKVKVEPVFDWVDLLELDF